MRRGLILFFAPLCLCLVLYAALLVLAFGRDDPGDPAIARVTGLTREKRAIAAAAPPGRVLFLGGSATLFGVRADIFEAETGLRAVNYGLNAGLGLPYLLEEAKAALAPGDVVVLLPELALYHGGEVDEVFSRVTFSLGATYPLSLPPRDILAWLRNVGPGHLFRAAGSRLFGPRDGQTVGYGNLTARGDLATYFAAAPIPDEFARSLAQAKANLEPWIEPGGGDPEDRPPARALADFNGWAQARGIRVLAGWPNVHFDPEFVARPAFRAFLARVEGLHANLGIPFLGDFEMVNAPADRFLDTHYHLGAPGAAERTRALARVFCRDTDLCRQGVGPTSPIPSP